MRKVIEPQMIIGEVLIENIEFDLSSRDEIPKLLQGLQELYCNKETRSQIFDILKKIIPININPDVGRRGMDLWNIFVLGVVRLNCNIDYDKLHDLANNHKKLREMLGNGEFNNETYSLQTIKDNVRLLTPEILEEINVVIVKHGHKIAGKKDDEPLKGSADSFVVETNAHYPTDTNLLFDSIRKLITLVMTLCIMTGISTWRQGKSNLRKIKKKFNKTRKLRKSTSKNPEKKSIKEKLLINAHIAYTLTLHKLICNSTG